MKPEKFKRSVRNLRWETDKNKRSGLPKTGKNRYRAPAKRSVRDRGGFSLSSNYTRMGPTLGNCAVLRTQLALAADATPFPM